jgi:hypothetical protein
MAQDEQKLVLLVSDLHALLTRFTATRVSE